MDIHIPSVYVQTYSCIIKLYLENWEGDIARQTKFPEGLMAVNAATLYFT